MAKLTLMDHKTDKSNVIPVKIVQSKVLKKQVKYLLYLSIIEFIIILVLL